MLNKRDASCNLIMNISKMRFAFFKSYQTFWKHPQNQQLFIE